MPFCGDQDRALPPRRHPGSHHGKLPPLSASSPPLGEGGGGRVATLGSTHLLFASRVTWWELFLLCEGCLLAVPFGAALPTAVPPLGGWRGHFPVPLGPGKSLLILWGCTALTWLVLGPVQGACVPITPLMPAPRPLALAVPVLFRLGVEKQSLLSFAPPLAVGFGAVACRRPAAG